MVSLSTGSHTEMDQELAEVKTVKSAERALEILEVLGEARGAMTVVELHRRTGYPRSSLHQLLQTLVAKKWVEQTNDGNAVRIGFRALLAGTTYLDRDEALPHAVRALERVRSETGYTSHYARLEDDSVLYLATRESLDPHRLTSRVGRQLPAHATALGKALLSELTAREVESRYPGAHLHQLTSHTVADVQGLLAQLETARTTGYAVEREENTDGISCVSAVVPYRIPATDAISCSIPLEQATEREIGRVADIIRAVTHDLAGNLRAEGIR